MTVFTNFRMDVRNATEYWNQRIHSIPKIVVFLPSKCWKGRKVVLNVCHVSLFCREIFCYWKFFHCFYFSHFHPLYFLSLFSIRSFSHFKFIPYSSPYQNRIQGKGIWFYFIFLLHKTKVVKILFSKHLSIIQTAVSF